MYTLINKETNKSIIIEAKKDVAGKINVHTNTITNRFNKNNPIETEKYIIYQAIEFIKRYRRGNTDSMSIKTAKANGDIPKNSDK